MFFEAPLLPQFVSCRVATKVCMLRSLNSSICFVGHWKGLKMIGYDRAFSIVGLTVFLLSAVLSTPAGAQGTETTLPDAIRRGLVEVAVCGMGASTGTAIIMGIKSRAGQTVRVRVPSGTVLRSKNASAQDMIVHRVEGKHQDTFRDIFEKCLEVARHEEERSKNNQNLSPRWLQQDAIVLQPNESGLYLMSAYCLDFEKGNPSPSTSFNIAEQAGPEAAQLFAYVGRNPKEYNIVAIQLATWAVNGNLDGPTIAQTFSFASQDRSDACRLLDAAGIGSQRKRLCNR
jgi:hypothetical protein